VRTYLSSKGGFGNSINKGGNSFPFNQSFYFLMKVLVKNLNNIFINKNMSKKIETTIEELENKDTCCNEDGCACEEKKESEGDCCGGCNCGV